MEIKTLKAKIREAAKKINAMRRENAIPAVVYGKGLEARAISVPYAAFAKLYKEVGETSLVDLKVGADESVKVVIHDIQRDPLSGKISHADFHQINMKEKLEADIPLNFVGESKAVKEFAGVLVKNMDTIAVRCLPSALVSSIDVDISALENFGNVIRARDIKLPEGMELMADANQGVITVMEPRSEKEMEELSAKPVEDKVAEVEVVGAKKEEGGEAAAAGPEEKK